MPIANEQTVSVEFATDEQFQIWIASCGIPVDDNGFAEWSFDDRCGVIMYALSRGLPLQFADTKNSETIPNNSEEEVVENTEAAQEEGA